MNTGDPIWPAPTHLCRRHATVSADEAEPGGGVVEDREQHQGQDGGEQEAEDVDSCEGAPEFATRQGKGDEPPHGCQNGSEHSAQADQSRLHQRLT